MAKQRRAARIKAQTAEMEDTTVKHMEKQQVKSKPDAKLFFLDAEGTKRPRVRAIGRKLGDPKPERVASKHESKKTEALAHRIQTGAAPATVAPKTKGNGTLRDGLKADAYDIWNEEDAAGGRGQKRKRQLHPSELAAAVTPAVEVPAPGLSYNPAVEDHQDALGVALAQEVARRRKIAEEEAMSKPKTDILSQLDDGGKTDSEDEDDDGRPLNKPTAADRMTTTERNKQARKKAEEVAAAEAEKERAMFAQIDAVQDITQELQTEEELKAQERAYRDLGRKERRARAIQRHSRVPRETDEPLAVPLSDELTGNLRTAPVVTTVVRDRFVSLHKRNKFELGKQTGRKERRVKWLAPKA